MLSNSLSLFFLPSDALRSQVLSVSLNKQTEHLLVKAGGWSPWQSCAWKCGNSPTNGNWWCTTIYSVHMPTSTTSLLSRQHLSRTCVLWCCQWERHTVYSRGTPVVGTDSSVSVVFSIQGLISNRAEILLFAIMSKWAPWASYPKV
jgi:hypothetical protein